MTHYSDKSAAGGTFLLKAEVLKLSKCCLDSKGQAALCTSLKTQPCAWDIINFNDW